MGYIGKIPSAVPLTSADITDNVITSAKIVDGTITNTDIASSIITGQTAETSIAGGDSILIYDDSATALRKMTKTNLFSGISNTPAFYASKSAGQTITTGTQTKITFPDETFDTDNCYSTVDSRFTPNVSGKYFVGANVRWDTDVDIDIADTSIYKNGNLFFAGSFSNIRYNNWFIGTVVTLNGTTDYVEIYSQQHSGVSRDTYPNGNQFFAYKLIGV